MANASQDLEVDLKSLVVEEARVDMGPLLGGRARWRPRSQGRAVPILKRTSHLIVGLKESPKRARRGAAPEAPPVPPAGGEQAAQEAAE
jgi:ribosomal protein L22